jgi:glycosyltransferase involved in cell wall biosynthesis
MNHTSIIECNLILPKVSICVVTYNQELYIEKCLKSILEQENEVEFEIIVGDDFSSDKTRLIILEIARNNPNKFRLFFHDKNIGALDNYKFVHEQARGMYIAHMDGDDYALPGKIKSQVKILDSDPFVALCAHAVRVEGESRLIGANQLLPTYASMDDLLMHGTYFVNSSTMYRSKNRFTHKKGLDIVDFYMYIEQASRGQIYLDKTPFGVYRWLPTGISKMENQRKRIEAAYENAFRRAEELGATDRVLKKAILKSRRSSAMRYLEVDNLEEFKSKIKIRFDEFSYAGIKHVLLYLICFLVVGRLTSKIIKKILLK